MSEAKTEDSGINSGDTESSLHWVKTFVAITVLIVSVGYLSLTAFQSAKLYYYTVGELQRLGPTEEGRVVRVSGKLVPGSFTREAESTLANFALMEGDNRMAAVLDGVVPDLFFNEHSEIVLEGAYTVNEIFRAHNVIVKCPSKYIASG